MDRGTYSDLDRAGGSRGESGNYKMVLEHTT